MQVVKMIRLKTGEDIIAQVSDDGICYQVFDAMRVSVEYKGKATGIAMTYWLPVQLIKNQPVDLQYADILTTMDPNDDLLEYYESTVERFHELIHAKEVVDAMSDEEMQDAFESMQLTKDLLVH